MPGPASVGLAVAGVNAPGRAEQLLDQHALLLVAANLLLVLVGLVCGGLLLLRLRRRPVDWSARVADLAWRPWQDRDVATIVLLILGGIPAAAYLVPPLTRLAARWDWNAGTVSLVGGSLAFQGVALVGLAVLVRRHRVSWADAFGLSLRRLPAGVAQGVVCLLAAVPLLIFYTLVYKVLLYTWGVDLDLQEQVRIIADSSSGGTRLYFVFLAAVLAPLVEELVFRGVLFPVLLQRMPLWAALTTVSALFAVMHFHVPSMAPLFVLSFAFCLAYLGTGTLWAPIVMHGLFNLSTVAVLYLLP